jgi:hypothetical protein
MIVRLDLERNTPIVADVDNAGVLTGRHDHTRTACRQAFEMNSRRFVEQCSDHITLNTPSSVKFGSRPMIVLIFSYSSV